MEFPRLGRALSGLVLALALATAPSTAHAASNWEGALPPDAVGSYLPGSGLRVLVAAAGQGADPAAAALTASLRALSSVKMTMPDDALGDLTAADDAAIVAKAKALPIDLIAVVRVFPGNAGAENVVATLYRVDGTVASAFTAGTDAPLVAQASTGAGMAGATASAVEAVVGGHSADLDARIKEFEDRAIWMQGYAAVDARSGQIVSTWSVPIQGRYGAAMSGPKFYEYVGQPEYAQKFKKRQTVRLVTMGAGAALIAGGLAYGLTAEDPLASMGPMLGLTLGGTTAMCIPFFIDPHPIPQNERSRLVDEHNEKLRKELGLPEVRPTSYGATFSASGWLGPSGGGAQIAGTF